MSTNRTEQLFVNSLTFKVLTLSNETVFWVVNVFLRGLLNFKKNIWSQTYKVTRGSAHSQTPAWSWLSSASYGCIVWQASLQAVLKNPAVGLQCFQMWPAWMSGTAHLCVNVSSEYHTPTTHTTHQCNRLSLSADVVKLQNCMCVLSMMSVACVLQHLKGGVFSTCKGSICTCTV